MSDPSQTGAHWRDSAREAKFGPFDAKAAFPLVFFLFHIKLWTFILAVSVMLFFGAISHYGFNLDIFGRFVRSKLAGARKVSSPWWM